MHHDADINSCRGETGFYLEFYLLFVDAFSLSLESSVSFASKLPTVEFNPIIVNLTTWA